MTLSFLPTGVIDCHIHFPHPDLAAGLLAVLDEHAIQRGNIVCTPHRARLSLVPDALLLKASRPDRITVFGGLDISALFLSPGSFCEYSAQYVRALMEMGCDGIKMIEGKPDMRPHAFTPGDTVQEMLHKDLDTEYTENYNRECIAQRYQQHLPLLVDNWFVSVLASGKAANPDDIAQLALFLASDESRHINGAIIPADGGWDAV